MSVHNPTPREIEQARQRMRAAHSGWSRECVCGQHYVPGTIADGACPTCTFERTGKVSEADVLTAQQKEVTP